MQGFVSNDKYLIKTPYGWDNFEGMTLNYHQTTHTVTLGNDTVITGSAQHQLLFDETPVTLENLNDGQVIDNNEIKSNITLNHDTPVPLYDIFNVSNSEHAFTIQKRITSKNCDELAFAGKKTSREMWSAVFPTLSCLSPETYVLGEHGYVKIKHYFHRDHQVGDYFEIDNQYMYTHNSILEPLSHGYVSPESDTLIIKTQTGYSVEVTLKHPLLTDKGMVQSQLLDVNDVIRCDLGMNAFGLGKHNSTTISYDETGYPEYVMMFNRISTIEFLESELFEDRPRECLYQQKLMLANLGIGCDISDGTLRILSAYEAEFIDIFGYTVSNVDLAINYQDNYFFDKIVSIEESYQEVTYDFTVPKSHSFLQNGIMGSNTGGKCIVTSTPSDDETLFAELWLNATKTIDEHGNDTDVGINGFKALKVKWDEHPERDETYKKLQIAQFGEEKFRREHELEFISMEETLIDPVMLSTYEGIEPISKTGKIRWYAPIDKEKIYVIGYDPSLGTGRDNSAIVVYEFPSMVQVGEWIHNKSDVPAQIRILKKILDMFRDAGFDEDNVFWSLENNTIGEAPLVMIKHEIGEDEFFGTFMKEKKRRGSSRVRGGFLTDHTEKMKACNRFKIWFEQGKMKVNSKAMIAELKGFVAQGRTYKARAGDTDDIVMATLLVVRMVEIIMQDEEEYLEELGVTASNLFDDIDDDDEEGWGAPMPML